MRQAKERELERVITKLLECEDFEVNTDLLIQAMNTDMIEFENGDCFTIGNLTRGAMRVLVTNWDEPNIVEEEPFIVGTFVMAVVANFLKMTEGDFLGAERIRLYLQMFLAEDDEEEAKLHSDFIIGINEHDDDEDFDDEFDDDEEVDGVEMLH